MQVPDLQSQVDWAYQRIRRYYSAKPIASRFRGKIRFWNYRNVNPQRHIVHYVNPVLYESLKQENQGKDSQKQKKEEVITEMSQSSRKQSQEMQKKKNQQQQDMILRALRPSKKKKIFKDKMDTKKLNILFPKD